MLTKLRHASAAAMQNILCLKHRGRDEEEHIGLHQGWTEDIHVPTGRDASIAQFQWADGEEDIFNGLQYGWLEMINRGVRDAYAMQESNTLEHGRAGVARDSGHSVPGRGRYNPAHGCRSKGASRQSGCSRGRHGRPWVKRGTMLLYMATATAAFGVGKISFGPVVK